MIDLPRSNDIGATLVVGGGIGGMQAALDLANAGVKVFLVEKAACVGGVMAQLDKTFPTNDCAMCTMAPRLADLSRQKDIELLTLSDVTQVTGEPGNFTVTVRKRPRYVDPAKCKSCGLCTSACPVVLPSEFDLGLTNRKAIHLPYPQGVPSAFSISRRGDAPCQSACPLHQSGQGYVTLIAQGRFEEALQVILRDNPLPSVCGRVCTHPCTAACTRGGVDDPINLPALKRFITDRFPSYTLPRPSAPDRSETIAIVGSGPAGLVCAHTLRQKGYRPTVYEALPVAGGMLAVGIPTFRLPQRILDAEVERLRASGIEFRLNTAVGRELTLDGLRQNHAAVFLAIGAHVERRLDIPGEDLPGVVGAVEFLRSVRLERPRRLGRRVLVIGGGNSALDAARTALRCGADQVTIVYRRTRDQMPADQREVSDAEREGIQFEFLAAPHAVHASADGRVNGLECTRMRLGAPDASGRPSPEPIPRSEFMLSCDAVIVTIGQRPDLESLGERLAIETTKWGTLKADPVTMETGLPGVFAGGDCVSGPDVIITAMLAGKKAANSIDRLLSGRDLRAGREREGPTVPEYVVDTTGIPVKREVAVPALDPFTRAATFDEIHTGYSEVEARAEAARCLSCAVCCDCHLCESACDAKAIDFTQRAESVTLQVGAIVLAPGYELFDARRKSNLGLGRFKNVVSAAQFERIMSASGPYDGHIVRPSDHAPPQRIAFIQCVGSRDVDRDYCSSVCCMYATKEALIAKEHCGEGLETDIFFMDARAYSKGFEAYYQRALEQGVRYIRCRPPVLEEIAGTGNVVIKYLTDDDVKAEREYDLVVLATGMLPPKDAPELARTFGIALNEFGFCRTTSFGPVESSRKGVFVCGPFTEPKDIPETVMQASGAASKVLALLRDVRGTLLTPEEYPPEVDVTGQEPRIGVFVCHCGTNIAGVVDVKDVAEYARGLPDVVYVETNLYTCSTDTQERIKAKIHEHRLNRVVVASCSPRTHEPLFRSSLREAGLNPYLFEMANIRDQCSWVHMHEPARATEKAKDLVRMALAKARLLVPLQKGSAPVKKAALVVGGGLAGMVASLDI
ncbi:MAG: FAD-dependent oxidoreductase, partial [Gemmatimonadaceae bacterium]